jgi:hypothetical protein
MSLKSEKWFWKLLSHKLIPNTWRYAIYESGIIASVHAIINKTTSKLVYQQVISSAFKILPTENIISNVVSFNNPSKFYNNIIL